MEVHTTHTGIVFDIKQFAVFDGPGIRQTVFLKGCPLRCHWCHNPEGLCMQPQLMVSAASCIHCGACKAVCTHKTCIACGACVPVCPLHLRTIVGTKMTPEELVEKLRKDSDYYSANGGGVTFSGGEPLLQWSFLTEVLDLIGDMHTCIETSGYAQPDVFAHVAQKLSCIIMDLKIFDRALHEKYTGVSNERILQNAKWLCAQQIPFTIRIPLIPGVNDNEENFRQTAQWIAGAPMLQGVELLPYHKTAGAKYAMLHQPYRPDFDIERPLYKSTKIFEKYGIRSNVL